VNASNQGLLEIPEALWKGGSGIGRLKSVKIVDLSMNSLRELPPRFVEYLGAIRKLDVSNNELLSLPVCDCGTTVRFVRCPVYSRLVSG
jgi:Leucine-rich repeat (LRR) protein